MEASKIYWVSPDTGDNGSNTVFLWSGMEASMNYWMSPDKGDNGSIFLCSGMEASIIYWMSPDKGDNRSNTYLVWYGSIYNLLDES
jgi:hypothetical protein